MKFLVLLVWLAHSFHSMKDQAPSVLVTRPQIANQSLASKLKERGFCPILQPCLSIIPLSLDAISKNIILELDRYRFVIAISVNAAQHGLAWFEDFWPQWPVGQSWMGVGKKTRTFLLARGVPMATMQLGASSEALIRSLDAIQWQDQRVLIVRGEGGREWLAGHLEKRGACVDYLECYRRVMPKGLIEDFQAYGKVPEFSVITISSGEVLRNLSKACAAFSDWFLIPLVVPSHRVGNMAHEMGWRNVVVAESAYDESIVAAVVEVLQD